MQRITVVGIGADGWAGLPEGSRALVEAAEVLFGGTRHLALVPERSGQVRASWPSPLRGGLRTLLDAYADRSVVVLASGDPMVSGIGSTLVEVLGADRVEVIPHVSSVALARARLGWSAESLDVVSLVGRDLRTVLPLLADGARLVLLSSDETTPSAVAGLLRERGLGASRMTVLGDLGAPEESRTDGAASGWDATAPRLNLVCVEVVADGKTRVLPRTPGLPDDAFEHDGQITKRDLRASALARLAPAPGAHLWDVGAGAGSVGIEWMRTHPRCRTTAVEADSERAARVVRNAGRLGVPALRAVTGRAPEALSGLDSPDAVFVGGGATAPGLLDACWDALPTGGRIVVHGVTLETEALLAERHRSLGGELVRLAVETAGPLGGFTGWTPARAVVQWSAVR